MGQIKNIKLHIVTDIKIASKSVLKLIKMGGGDPTGVPIGKLIHDEKKLLADVKGYEKIFNNYTVRGRRNCVLASFGFYVAIYAGVKVKKALFGGGEAAEAAPAE